MLSRQWKHVDLEQGWLRLDPGESKNGEARNFPLTTELHAILSKQREAVRRLEREQGVLRTPHVWGMHYAFGQASNGSIEFPEGPAEDPLWQSQPTWA